MQSTLIILANLLALTSANPLLEARAQCNQDNCYRQLQRASSGSAYCRSTVLNPTSTITVTPTVISIYGSTVIGTQTVAAVTKVPTASPTPTFASSCTGASTRVSSACGCLLNSATPVTQATVTATAAVTTRVVCGPADNYGVVYAPGTGNFQSGRIPFQAQNPTLDFPLDFTDDYQPPNNLQQCCRFCYQTSGCINFGISRDSSYCNLVTITGSDKKDPTNPICPNGLLAVLDPSRVAPEDAYYGIGQCSYEVSS